MEEFNRYWALVDSDNNGEVTYADMYAAMDVIPDFGETEVETFW